jgi:type VI secretion system protein ImpH
MAAKNRSPDTTVSGTRKKSVAEVLAGETYRFDFFQAVRMLERIYPGKEPIGYYARPSDEVVRFCSHVSTSFPASQLYEIEGSLLESDEGPVDLWLSFMGLVGALGALPAPYTELAADPGRSKETAPLRDFLDVFNHRFVSLFYRAWEKYRFPIAYERGGVDTFSGHLYSLIGMGTDGLRGRLGVDDNILLFYAGLLSQRPRSAVALEGILQDYFDVPVKVIQFAGEWFLMNPENLTSLGANAQNNQLGVDALLWARVWDPPAKFRVRVGPLSFDEFREFLPIGSAYPLLLELTRFYVGEEFNFEVQLVLDAEEVPVCVLGDEATRLGWSVWLKTREFEEDSAQPVLQMRVARFEPESQGAKS